MKEQKLLTIGEAHLAFVPIDDNQPLEISDQFTREAGGSPINVAVAAAKLNVKTEYLGKLGKDPFGNYIANLLRTCGVGTSYLSQTPLAPTHVFFRSKVDEKDGFYPQKLTSNGLLRPDDLNEDWINRGDVLYCSSHLLSQNSSNGAIEKVFSLAGKKGAFVAFAPQFNPYDWPNKIVARETILQSLPYAHLLILSEDEVKYYSDKIDEHFGIKELFGGKTMCMIILRGDKGITYVTQREKGHIRFTMNASTYPTGINDAFIGYLLSDLLKYKEEGHEFSSYFHDVFNLEERLEEALKYRSLISKKGGTFAAN